MRWKVLAIPDTHFPFEHSRALNKLFREVISEVEFTHIIQLGDLLDQYSFTRFTKKNLYLPERELKWGREKAEKFWAKIHDKQPKARKIQLLGNHDYRMVKRAQEKLPEAQELILYATEELYEFDNVHTVKDPRQEYFLNDVAFLHGYLTQPGAHTRFMNMSTVHGHTHRGGVTFVPVRKGVIWELDCGYLGDPKKEPLNYTPQKFKNATLGYGVIDEFGPRFCPIHF